MSEPLAAASCGRVLVVDDQAESLLATSAILEGLGAEIVTARSGREALRHVLSGEFAVILLDVQMPEMDGFETADLIRDHPRSRVTPIIFLTATYGAVPHILRGYASGAVDYLEKPPHPEILRSKVRVFLALAEAAATIRRQAAELAAQRDHVVRVQKQKDNLASFIVHDLKNPLNAIIGGLQSWEDAAARGENPQQLIDVAIGGAHEMHRLVLELLDVARSQDGNLHAVRAPVDMLALARGVAELARAVANERGQSIEIVCLAESPVYDGDGDLLRRLLWNLMDNCLKATPRGGRVQVELSRPEAGRFEIRVRDTGPGIPRHLRERVFDVFARFEYRGESWAARSSRGLGLAFCVAASSAHGGSIAIEDEPGWGCVFRVGLPEGGVAEPAAGSDT